MFGKPEPTVQELVTACVVKKEGAEVRYNLLQISFLLNSFSPHLLVAVIFEKSVRPNLLTR